MMRRSTPDVSRCRCQLSPTSHGSVGSSARMNSSQLFLRASSNTTRPHHESSRFGPLDCTSTRHDSSLFRITTLTTTYESDSRNTTDDDTGPEPEIPRPGILTQRDGGHNVRHAGDPQHGPRRRALVGLCPRPKDRRVLHTSGAPLLAAGGPGFLPGRRGCARMVPEEGGVRAEGASRRAYADRPGSVLEGEGPGASGAGRG